MNLGLTNAYDVVIGFGFCVSSDLSHIDVFLPDTLSQTLFHGFNTLGAVVIACVAVPYFAIVLVLILWAFAKLQNFYRVSSRELKRLEGVTRYTPQHTCALLSTNEYMCVYVCCSSPIFSSFGETLAGLTTIRAYGLSAEFIARNRALINRYAKIHWNFIISSRWFSMRLDMLSLLVLLGVGVLGVFLPVDAAVIGVGEWLHAFARAFLCAPHITSFVLV